jgi:plastocyanin
MEPTEAPPKDLVQSLLDVVALFIQPDWNALLALFPVLLLVLFVAWFAWTSRKFATLGPTRRAPARIQPLTPAHVHMPGGSVAPILVAVGAGALFLGLVLGGVALGIGVTVLVITLLVWFREAIRDYDHIEATSALPAVIHEGPPPGVHMPGPSIRPLLGALGTAALLGGLVMGGWVLILAVVFLVWTLLGWLVDFTAEYRKVEEADQSAGPTGPTIVAKAFGFDAATLEVAAGAPFTILFRNEDPPGTPHDVDVRSGDGTTLQDQPVVDGGAEESYEYEPLEAGEYVFICSFHPDLMTGTLTVQ